ncbi:MAG TPA: phosphate-starvation-inducible PsiE family protein [Ginsengibacter sp.]|nr:phosphate-starvation-inducible PsiE family protein [Ginsengibacter sp.]
MIKFSDRFEKIISAILLAFAMLFIVFQVVQLLWNTVESFSRRFREAGMDYAPEYGRTVAILFFNILLMMEIMQTIKVFAENHIIKVRIILIVCLIAVSRKILALGETTVEPMADFAIAALIISLSAGYYLVSRNSKELIDEEKKDEK